MIARHCTTQERAQNKLLRRSARLQKSEELPKPASKAPPQRQPSGKGRPRKRKQEAQERDPLESTAPKRPRQSIEPGSQSPWESRLKRRKKEVENSKPPRLKCNAVEQGLPRSPSRPQNSKRKREAEEQELPKSPISRRQSSELHERQATSVDSFVGKWLDTVPGSQGSPVDEAPQRPPDVYDMPPKMKQGLLSPNSDPSIPNTGQSSKSTASVHDSVYRSTLDNYNIFIEKYKPADELKKRAKDKLSRSRESPELDDPTVEDLRDTLRSLQDEDEDEVRDGVARQIFPAIGKSPSEKLRVLRNLPWNACVPIPLDSNIFVRPLPLPKPKPDYAFGYSEMAFTRRQNKVLELFTNDSRTANYAMPRQHLRFPCLTIEFKSQATGGTLFKAVNQNAGAGAVSMAGLLELQRRSLGMENFDFNEPRFFSVAIDQENAKISVHWVSELPENRGYAFHLETVSRYILDDPAGLRALNKAIKNILDDSVGSRLVWLRKALDAYAKKVEQERSAPNQQEAPEMPPPPIPQKDNPPARANTVKRRAKPPKNTTTGPVKPRGRAKAKEGGIAKNSANAKPDRKRKKGDPTT